MKKRFGLLSGLFLISMLFVVSVFTGNALADQCEPCYDLVVEKPEAISDQEKFQPIVVASAHSAKYFEPFTDPEIVQPVVVAPIFLSNPADSFETLLAGNFTEITEKQGPIGFGRTSYLIKPYVLSGAEMKWIQVMNLEVKKSQNTHCPCPWRNDPLSEFELHEADGIPVLTADFR